MDIGSVYTLALHLFKSSKREAVQEVPSKFLAPENDRDMSCGSCRKHAPGPRYAERITIVQEEVVGHRYFAPVLDVQNSGGHGAGRDITKVEGSG